ncbi:MAG: argininosuccinate lyase [Nitrospirae bacterium GWD2_57_9]|nr:MAG: argininosuccinate lyase [Nitrospirae bacterium GWD2_57_9]OGW47222.1 MAG: argininosuccinate lyase [Nitrospirae bacterium GWC2_57_9]
MKAAKKLRPAKKAPRAAKAWSGRFTETTNRLVEEFTASIPYDWRLYPYDIAGSIVHAGMLARQRIITRKEADRITRGLEDILKEIVDGTFEFSTELEDIHMNIENRLIEKIGPVGGKLHTARSRNDQVALDIRMYLRDEIAKIHELLAALQKVLVGLADRHRDVVLPGYTHLQRAQPVLFGHHLLAYYEMFQRDRGRLEDCFRRLNMMPLGAGALAGTVLPIDRKFVARELGFSGVCENSMDAVSDRDFAIEFVAACAQIMMHLSRLSEELVLWSTSEFGFITISDAFTTGSSIMPQKKNPDVAELTRGKTGRVYGSLTALLTLMKGLPLAYNRDMQEDKEPLFDAADTVSLSLSVFAEMLKSVSIHTEAMRRAAEDGFITATDLADYLVRKGMPFREAHEVVGRAVLRCLERHWGLGTMPLEEYQRLSPLIREDVYDAISVEASVTRRTSSGGTAPANLARRLQTLKKRL